MKNRISPFPVHVEKNKMGNGDTEAQKSSTRDIYRENDTISRRHILHICPTGQIGSSEIPFSRRSFSIERILLGTDPKNVLTPLRKSPRTHSLVGIRVSEYNSGLIEGEFKGFFSVPSAMSLTNCAMNVENSHLSPGRPVWSK